MDIIRFIDQLYNLKIEYITKHNLFIVLKSIIKQSKKPPTYYRINILLKKLIDTKILISQTNIYKSNLYKFNKQTNKIEHIVYF
jgi:hypothetical protein